MRPPPKHLSPLICPICLICQIFKTYTEFGRFFRGGGLVSTRFRSRALPPLRFEDGFDWGSAVSPRAINRRHGQTAQVQENVDEPMPRGRIGYRSGVGYKSQKNPLFLRDDIFGAPRSLHPAYRPWLVPAAWLQLVGGGFQTPPIRFLDRTHFLEESALPNPEFPNYPALLIHPLPAI